MMDDTYASVHMAVSNVAPVMAVPNGFSGNPNGPSVYHKSILRDTCPSVIAERCNHYLVQWFSSSHMPIWIFPSRLALLVTKTAHGSLSPRLSSHQLD